MRPSVLFTGFFLLLNMVCRAQYAPVFSQYMFNPLIINPAYAGQADALSLSLSYRNQWSGFSGAPVTQAVTAHTPIFHSSIGMGFTFVNDQYGVTNNNDALIALSYRYRIGKYEISAGFQGGLTVMKNNWQSLVLSQPDDPAFTTGNTLVAPKVGGGLYLHSKKSFFGASVPQVTITSSAADYQKAVIYTPWFVYGGLTFDLNEKLALKPVVLVRTIANAPIQTDVNLMAWYNNRMGAGVSYRQNDAVVFLLNMKLNRQLSLGYSYDYISSNLHSYNKGTNEILIRYDFKYYVNDKDPRMLR